MTMILEFQLIVRFQVEVLNLMEINHCTVLPFVEGGYNRILLAFRSLLCGQMHLNVSTVSCLFRSRLEIGKHKCQPGSYYLPPWFVSATHCLPPDFYGSQSNNAGDSALIYNNRCYNCTLMAG